MSIVSEIIDTVDRLLEPALFKDYCPNGLQVQGTKTIQKIVSGVTASKAFIDAALAANADCLLVHHGLFWKGDDFEIVGIKYARLKPLIENGAHLLAYHLPLDAHSELGNNAQLALKLG